MCFPPRKSISIFEAEPQSRLCIIYVFGVIAKNTTGLSPGMSTGVPGALTALTLHLTLALADPPRL